MSGIIAQNTLDNSGLVKAPAGGGAWTFISKQTASADSTISFTSGIDSTYAEYIFYFVNIHHATINKYFSFNVSIDGGSNYNVAKTSTHFRAYHYENDGGTALEYSGGDDLAQGTGIQHIGQDIGINNDDSTSGYLHLFNPSSTVFVKHFIARTSNCVSTPTAQDAFTAGYINSTSAVNSVQFSSSSGDIDSGDIFLHGLTI